MHEYKIIIKINIKKASLKILINYMITNLENQK